MENMPPTFHVVVEYAPVGNAGPSTQTIPALDCEVRDGFLCIRRTDGIEIFIPAHRIRSVNVERLQRRPTRERFEDLRMGVRTGADAAGLLPD